MQNPTAASRGCADSRDRQDRRFLVSQRLSHTKVSRISQTCIPERFSSARQNTIASRSCSAESQNMRERPHRQGPGRSYKSLPSLFKRSSSEAAASEEAKRTQSRTLSL